MKPKQIKILDKDKLALLWNDERTIEYLIQEILCLISYFVIC